MRVLVRTEFGNPLLRRRARSVPLKLIKTARFKKLIAQMIYTMRRVQGVGLAAPQVGSPLQLAVIETRPTKNRPKLKKRGPIVVVNPKILSFSKETVKDWEGCLSFEGVRGRVPRPKEITISYYNERGEKVVEKAKGLWARIFQHEVDHLNGTLYVDRMPDMTSLMTYSEFKNRILKKK
jgi:peptide deformylase